MAIDTDRWSAELRAAAIDLEGGRLLVTNFRGTLQEHDLTEPANCNGFGRIRHFRRQISSGWPENPLPIDPAGKALGLPHADLLRAQVFQNAVCSWRCWYCFVPYALLRADRKHSDWVSPEALLDLYLAQENPSPVIDLSGGQPDLIPEWVPWMMATLTRRGLQGKVYLWSDDNLSNDYFWRYLSEDQRELVGGFRNYGRVGCIKGFSEESFSFNTGANPALFGRQFELIRRFLSSGIDMYCYVTLTCRKHEGILDDVRRFVDRLQDVDENLPLRTVPLKIEVFTPVEARLRGRNSCELKNQWTAVEAWQRELSDRFSLGLRALPITEIPLKDGN